MPKFLPVLILVAMSVFTPVIVHSKEGKPMNEDQKNVLAAVKNMTAAFHNRDIEGVMASYENNATIVFEPEAPISDSAVLREMFLGAFKMSPHFDYSGHEVIVAGDIAVHFAPWTMEGNTPEGELIKQSGLSVAVLRKQADGRWLIVIDNPHGQRLMENRQNQ